MQLGGKAMASSVPVLPASTVEGRDAAAVARAVETTPDDCAGDARGFATRRARLLVRLRYSISRFEITRSLSATSLASFVRFSSPARIARRAAACPTSMPLA